METSATIKKDPKERLIESGTMLFAEKGFKGASVREICKHAGTSMNMIHHYFGNKDGLLKAILDQFTLHVFTVPMRIIEKVPETREAFFSRFELFVEETLEALISQRLLYKLIAREGITLPVLTEYGERFVAFVEKSKAKGLVRKELDAEMVTGFILDRLGNQILYAGIIQDYMGYNIVSDKAYRERWLKANIDLFLKGMMEKK